MKKLMMTGILATLLLAPLTAFARPGVGFRSGPVVVVHRGFGWGWGGYWGPYWGPYPYYGYYDNWPDTGSLKFNTKDKSAGVYVNGAYAGTIGELKTMHLRPGSYDIEVREQGRTQLDQKVYIAAGRTLHLNPDLSTQDQTR
jgi:PEGA domain